jgi:hypothetical protein
MAEQNKPRMDKTGQQVRSRAGGAEQLSRGQQRQRAM